MIDSMPMDREVYEGLIGELNNPELDHTRRTEILQNLREDYNVVQTDFAGLQQTSEKLTKEKMDLLESNSQLFRKLGVVGNGSEKKEEEKKKEFSETISLEELERGRK
jgi:hypothetical protein